MDKILVFLMKLPDDLDIQLINDKLHLVDHFKRERILQLNKLQDKARSLFGDLLMRYVIIKKIGIPNNEIHIARNKFGKPYLSNVNGYEYNITHAGEWVACAIGKVCVGIDIEMMTHVDKSIAKIVFSNEEYDWFINQGQESNVIMDGFFRLWTMKESYMKAIGTGFHTQPKSFTIPITSGEALILFQKESKFFFKQYDFDPKYKLSVCSMSNLFCETPEIVAFTEVVHK